MAEASSTTPATPAAAPAVPNIDGFDLLSCIATGNISQVWEVKEVATGQQYAMKLLLPEAFRDPEQKGQLKHEAKIGKSFEHPNLIRVYDLRVTKKHAYFTMEFFRGANLKSMIRSDLTSVQVRAKKIMEGVTQALAHMHEKGWVHKDIKPENILMTRGGDVRLIDFSLTAKSAGALTKMLKSKKSVIIQGTRTYIAPELVRRNPATTAVDMYSLGITLYEMLTGKPPFIQSNPDALLMAHIQSKPETPSVMNPNITPELDRLVLKMLAKSPKDRPSNMQEAFAEIRSINFFKTDMEEHARAAEQARQENFKDSMASRLDSRTDADRTPEQRKAAEVTARDKAKKLEAGRIALKKSREGNSGKTPTTAAPQPAQPPMMMPGAFPMAPGFPMQMPAPGFPMPMQGFPMPPAPFPQPMPGQPMMPGQPLPMPGQPMPMPGQPTPMPAAVRPPAPAPAVPPAAAPTPAAAPRRKTSAPQIDPASIPLMEEGELPDVE
ncbi:MAG: serine/threonine protein kinase [Planctomycetaceae bacterium]|nr:serine/threonine protein kinase [Planctomycetaceae bacterium]